MTELIPAIDIIDGRCVRLTKGDYRQMTVYTATPADTALMFEKAGAKRLHVVDLDGARSGHVVNIAALRSIAEATSLCIDFGGGIKTDHDIEQAFDAGAAMVTVGSVAISHPQTLERWLGQYGPERLILGADVRHGRISINGWADDTAEDLLPFLKRHTDMGIVNVLCTDISRDGTLEGPAIELYKEIMRHHPQLHLIASGGIGSMDDIRALRQAGLPAAVIGKAIYEGRIDTDKLWEWQDA